MSLLQKYLTIDGLYLCNYPPEDIYVLLIQVLSLPHTVDEAIQIFESMIPSQFEYYKSLDISRPLALACQDVDTRLVEKMLSCKHHGRRQNLSYYYPYMNVASLDIMLQNKDNFIDDDILKFAFVGKTDLLAALLSKEIPHVSWDNINKMLAKYPISQPNRDLIVEIYGDEILPK